MSEGSASRAYAVRRVNPFIGVQQIIDTPHGRATSADGVHWDLEITTRRARVLGVLERDADGRVFIRFGLWSAGQGHVMTPSKTLLMQDRELREKADRLVEEVRQRQSEVPFALADSHELWLFDESGLLPLALLATRLPQQAGAAPQPRTWQSSPGGAGGPGQRRFAECRQLEVLVNRRAGFNSKRAWVRRGSDGDGVRDDCATRIEADGFPALLVRRHWEDATEAGLVERYLCWLAPSLLTLPGLDDEHRDWLERHLHLQAASVEYHWRLYPKVLSPKRVRAARVQGRLMQAR